jgi:hypothetical protein
MAYIALEKTPPRHPVRGFSGALAAHELDRMMHQQFRQIARC